MIKSKIYYVIEEHDGPSSESYILKSAYFDIKTCQFEVPHQLPHPSTLASKWCTLVFPQEFIEKCLKNAEDLMDSLPFTYFPSSFNDHSCFKKQMLQEKNHKKNQRNNMHESDLPSNVSSFSINIKNNTSFHNYNSKIQKTLENNPLATLHQTTSPEELRMISNLHSLQAPCSSIASTADLNSLPPAITSLSLLNSPSCQAKDFISENELKNSQQSYLTSNSDEEIHQLESSNRVNILNEVEDKLENTPKDQNE
jgi:hypothetical protein